MKFSTGGKVHEPLAESVKFRYRRYSPDERSISYAQGYSPCAYVAGIFSPTALRGRGFAFRPVERKYQMNKTNKMNDKVKFITVTAVLAALATVLQFFEFPIPFLIPTFVKFDFSDLPALLAAFLVSPISGAAVCVIKNVIHTLTSQSGFVGELANAILGICMVLPAGIIYKIKPTRKAALIGCAVGAVISGFISIFVNYYISYPFYITVMGFPLEAILGEYQKLSGNVVTLWDALIWFNAPFTLVKMAIDSAITFVIYKPISRALKNI